MTTQSVERRDKRRKSPTSPTLTRLTAREAGELLGVSHETIYAMAKRGQLPAVPIGIKGWRFFREPLLEWQARHLAAGLEVQS